MRSASGILPRPWLLLLGALLAFAVLTSAAAGGLHAGSTGVAADSAAAPAVAASDAPRTDAAPTKKDLIQPAELVPMLALPEARRPVLMHVGFPVLYKGGHIAGSRFAGPGSNPKGRAELKRALQSLPKDRAIVLYCGCCPWVHCPNVNPAFRTARSLGYTNVKILYIVQDMQRDWVAKGLPPLEASR